MFRDVFADAQATEQCCWCGRHSHWQFTCQTFLCACPLEFPVFRLRRVKSPFYSGRELWTQVHHFLSNLYEIPSELCL